MPGVKCIPAGGAFYAFPDTRGAIESLAKRGVIKAANDLAFSEYLLEKAGVAVVPGSAFGAEGYLRISFATSMDNLKNALARIHQAII
jgi:aspartate aminotransferase